MLALLLVLVSSLYSLSEATCTSPNAEQYIDIGTIASSGSSISFTTATFAAFLNKSWDFTTIELAVDGGTCTAASNAACNVTSDGANTYNVTDSYRYYWAFTKSVTTYTITATSGGGSGGHFPVNGYVKVCQLSCDVGYYVNSLTQACSSCTAGNYCLGGLTAGQTTCTSGNYCGSTGLSAQTPCAAGSYCQSVTTQVTCTSGNYCTAGLTAQLPCTAGNYCEGNGLTAPVPCTTGHYCASASLTAPVACTAGFYCDVVGLSAQIACTSGYYCTSTGLSAQVQCPLGSYCPNVLTLSSCTAGSYCGSAGLVAPTGLCQAGYYCPPGSSSAQSNQCATAGTLCEAGSSVVSNCPAGFYCPNTTIKVSVPAGTYSATTGLTAAAVSTPCPIATYCPVVGSTASTTCPAGSYCATSGLSAVTGLCQLGYYCNSGSTTATQNLCTVSGTYCAPGSTNGTTPCSPGFVCPNASTQTTCPAGNYCPPGATGVTICPMTPIATFCASTGMSAATVCTAGFYCNATGLTVESGLCAAGYWCGAGSRSKFGLTNGAGLVNTLVGAGQRGSADGVGVAATSFNQPTAMTIDSTGSTLYVADSGTGLIRRVQVASSTVSTPSLPASTRFIGAQGLATSGSWLYVADTNCHRIVKVNLTAPVTTSAVAGQFPSCSSTWNVYVGSTPDGNGTSARFSFPKGMALSPNGATMYVSDSGFNRIRSVSLSTGVVTTLAGGTAVSANKAGTADGLGNVAMFNGPFGIAIDPTGTILYVADLNNHAIRRIVISPASVSTLAGNVNVPGYLDGVGTTAQLSGPTGIAIDSTGAILYVVDNFNQNLRQVIIATRVVTTIAGSTLANLGWNDALGTSALFSFPTGVVILPGAVTMMVSDTMNNRIRKVDFVQQCQDGVYCPAGTSAILASSCPAGTYCPAGSAPVACPVNTYCSASSPSSAGNSIGNVTTIAGSSSSAFYDGIGRAAMFFSPSALVVNSQGDTIYVADSLNNRIRSVALDSAFAVSTLAGNGKPGFFDNVGRLAVLNNPQGITFDPTNTYLYFSDTGNHVIRRIWIATAQLITLAGTGSASWVDGTGTAAAFNTPHGIVVDPLGVNIYVSDQANNCIRSVTILSLAVTTIAGNRTAAFNDAIGTSAAMSKPSGLAIQSGAQFLYFADAGNHRIRVLNLVTRVTSTLAGNGIDAWADGVGTAASFSSPVGIALSPNDAFLFVADTGNNCLRRVSIATLAVTTLSGPFSGLSGLTDGWGTSVLFNLPSGIAMDASSASGGNTLLSMYVADMQNNVVRKVQLTPAWCDPGFYCPLGSSMPNGTGSCAAGTYCNGVSATPLICPAGLWCGAQTSSASGSGQCQAGYFCPAGSSNSTMHACPNGTYCPTGASAAVPCAAGSFCATSASQVACTAGSYCPASTTSMDGCAAGSMCPTPTVQTVCAAGTYCPVHSTYALTCPAGAYCPAGTSSANANICPFGTFCAPGSTAPSFCPVGSYCLNTTTQLICASGSFCPAYSTAPSPCEAGSFCLTPSHQITCTAGNYCPTSSTSQTVCPVGRYCPAGSSSPSLVCPAGVYCPTGMTGIGGAGLCSPGSYCIAGSSSPTQAQCGGGFFCPAGSTAATGSGMCSQGYYCPVGSMNATGAGRCSAGYTCPIGSMYPTGRNMLRRDACPAGYFCPAGSWVSVPCSPGLYSPTTGAASCSFCPSGMFSNTTASTSCQPCPDKMFCLLGNPVPIPATYQQNTSQTVFNPFPLESIEANNELTTITLSIGTVVGCVFVGFVLFAISAKRLLPRRVLQSFKSIDMLFGAAHVIGDGDYYRVYTTWLGGIFTLLAVCLILMVAALLTLQNTTVPTQTTDLSTAPPASDPLGYFAIEVGVFGSDLSTACANMSISQGAPGDWIGTVVRPKPVYTAKFNSCVVRWMCAKCSIGSRTLNPTFTLTSILPSWASFYNITLWTPALGGVGLLPFSVNQIFSPTATISDLSGFRSSATANDPAVKPSMVLQLTSFTVKTGSESEPIVRTTFQPSITAATSQPVNGPDVMNPTSSTDLLETGPAVGFMLSLLLQRNTLNIVVNSVQPNIFNIIVLIGSASGSLISALAAIFKQLEPRIMKMQGSKPEGVEETNSDEEDEEDPDVPKKDVSRLPSQIVLERSRRNTEAPLASVSAAKTDQATVNPYLWTTNPLSKTMPTLQSSHSTTSLHGGSSTPRDNRPDLGQQSPRTLAPTLMTSASAASLSTGLENNSSVEMSDAMSPHEPSPPVLDSAISISVPSPRRVLPPLHALSVVPDAPALPPTIGNSVKSARPFKSSVRW